MKKDNRYKLRTKTANSTAGMYEFARQKLGFDYKPSYYNFSVKDVKMESLVAILHILIITDR